MKNSDKVLLDKLKMVLNHKFPDMINEIIVYGSRGLNNKLDADFDFTIITNRKIGWQEQRNIKNIIYDYGIDMDIVFDPKIFSMQEFSSDKSRFTFRRLIKDTGIRV